MKPVFRALFSIIVALHLLGCRPTGLLGAPPTPTDSPSPIVATIARPTPTISPAPATATVAPTSAATPSPAAVAQPLADSEEIPTPPPRDLLDLRQRLGARASTTGTATPVPHQEAIGDLHAFWIANQVNKTYFRSDARLVYLSPHALWYLQSGVSLPDSAIQAAASFFESKTYPMEQRLFGTPKWTPGEGQDPRITILIGRIPGVGGYFSSSDEYPTSVNPFSNQREMIYINVDSARPGAPAFDQTVAHEFMHMIQFHVHRSQDSWIDEGSAEVASQAVTGATSGAVRAFERSPETQLNTWASESSASVPHYGAAYLFLRYVAEQYGGFESIGKIIAEPRRSIGALEQFFQSIPRPVRFDDVFADWTAANYLNDRSLDGGRYGYQGLKVSPTIHPGPTPGQTINAEVTQFGTTYYRIQSDRPAELRFRGATEVKLIGAATRGTPLEWWSNQGDSIDTRLTREVDLRGVTRASLHFSAWYDIEDGYDYAYVMVSADGGRTWETLPASSTTSEDPNGQNYGNGLTGTSGGNAPIWISETVNLDRYVGQRIQLRFEYVTDDAYHADGLAVTGISIPEIGWTDTGNRSDGWVADGFVRIENRVPQTYLVQVLSPTGVPVERMKIGSDGTGTLRIEPNRSVVVAVAGLTPLTSQKSGYELSLNPVSGS